MSAILVLVLFLLLTIGWIFLPFIPGVVELRRKTDAWPLRVVHGSEVDIRHFARGFRSFVESNFGDLLERCRAQGTEVEGELGDGTRYLVVADGEPDDSAVLDRARDDEGALVLASGDLELAGDAAYPLEIFTAGSLSLGANAVVRAALAEQSISIGPGSTSIRWLHAADTVEVADDCQLYGRVSANRSIVLGEGCAFERLHAPRIEFGSPVQLEAPEVREHDVDPKSLRNLAAEEAGRWLFRKRTKIPAGGRVEQDIVVRGKLTIGDGVRITGNIKSHDEMELGRDVEILGSVTSESDIRVGQGSRIRGTLISEEKVYLGDGCTVGTAEDPTTICARGVDVASGVVVHGTVWGRG